MELDTICASLTQDPLKLEDAVKIATLSSTGAVATFLGVTRSPGHNGKQVVSLDFEAYEPMALASLRSIAREAVQKFELSSAVVVHRTGRVHLGDASLMVVVSSPHRAPSLQALPWIVDTVKLRVAVWKKEEYSDGTVAWVHGCVASKSL